MGRRRTKKSSKNSIDREIKFVFGIVLSIFLFVIIYGKTGYLNKQVSPILGGIFGPIKYIVPFGVLYLTFSDIVKKEETSKRINIFVIVIILICSLLTIYSISKYNLNISVKAEELIKECYNLGTKQQGGGVIGAVVAVPAIKLLGKTGASIVIIFAAILLSILTFGYSAIDYAKDIVTNIEESKQKIRLRRAEKRAEKYELIKDRESKLEEYHKTIEKEENIVEDGKGFSFFDLFSRKDKETEQEKPESELNIYVPEDDESYSEKLKLEQENKEREVEEKNIPVAVRRDTLKPRIEKKESGDGILYVDLDLKYKFPQIDLLKENKNVAKISKSQIEKTALGLQKTLMSFGVSAKVQNVTVGPTVTRYELKPAIGVKVNRIKNLSDDIALNLAASTIRIEAPIPGKRAVGIEVPNEKPSMVSYREVIDTPEFLENNSPLAFALGKGVDGKAVIGDLDKMRHLLVAGATGSGKSVCINTIINSIIYHATPQEVKMIMIDPKVVELSNYNKIPHLCQSVVTDVEKASQVLKWSVDQMTKRYNKFAEYRAKDLDSYNKKVRETEPEKQIPRLVILVDELADLMMAAAKDVEDSICRIAQMGRAAGIHLIIATQRPSADVITGLIKANIPSRIAFTVTSGVDSRIILDSSGAEKLLGKGDMLYYPMGATKPARVQGAFITDEEIAKIIKEIGLEELPENRKSVEESFENQFNEEEIEESELDEDEYLFEAIDTIFEFKQASKTFLRRKFSMGDIRAGRLVDRIEELGIIGPQISTKPREILIDKMTWEKMKVMKWPELFVLEGEESKEELSEDEYDEYLDEDPNDDKFKNTKKEKFEKTKEIDEEELEQEDEFDDEEIEEDEQKFFESELIGAKYEKPEVYYEDGEEKIAGKVGKFQQNNAAADLLLNQAQNYENKTFYEEVDPLLKIAVETAFNLENPNTDGLARELQINTSRAQKLIDQMSDIGIIIKDQSENYLNITKTEWNIMKENF